VGLTIRKNVSIGVKVTENSTEPSKMDETEKMFVAVLDTVGVGVFECVGVGGGVDIGETDLEAE
jgi:uncharacterized membrane protein YeiH